MPPVDIPPLTLTERLSLARQRAGVSRETIATKLGVSTRTVTRYEKGATPAPFEAVVVWSDLTHVPLEWLAEPVLHSDVDSGCIPRSQLHRFRLALDGDLAQLSLFGGAEPALPDPDEVNRVLCSLPGNDRRYHQIPVAVDRRHELAAA